ncbi:hypothetical protein F4802DRAFT_545195 [Xylaria palmicola]|nr:hypothetical protein F4802DRAFT_545195 [Xylaria palmicola]
MTALIWIASFTGNAFSNAGCPSHSSPSQSPSPISQPYCSAMLWSGRGGGIIVHLYPRPAHCNPGLLQPSPTTCHGNYL